MLYALIENNKVKNIISADEKGAESLIAAGLNLVPTNEKPVAIGDDYTDGKFYRDGSEVLTPTEGDLLVQANMKAALQTLGVETEEKEETVNAE